MFGFWEWVGNVWVLFVFLRILANFCASLMISCPLSFLMGTRHLQYPLNNFSPEESPQNGTQPGSLLQVFPTLRPPPYFFHIPCISFQKTPAGHSWNGWEICGFHSPPARWGLLDFMSVASFRSSSAPAFRLACLLLVLSSSSSSNCDLRSTAFPAGPQPRPSPPSVPCRTSRISTASIHAKCSLPDLM